MKRTLQLTAVAIAAAMAATTAVSGASAAPITYSISAGASGSYNHPTDSPASPFIDKDGSFHFQQSASLYAANQVHKWEFYKGTSFDDAQADTALNTAVNPANSADANNNTVWRCNNSTTGKAATPAPTGSSYAYANYCDLIGTWIDPDTGNWVGLVHNEFTPQPFGDGMHYDAIDYAVSTDQGKTWAISGQVLTSPYSTKRNDTAAFPNQTYAFGDGDQRLFVDTASGYFYVYYGTRIINKAGVGDSKETNLAHVARAPISGKMATGTWQKWYDGAWSQAGVGGQESNIVPADQGTGSGYTPTNADYNPANVGTVTQQVAAGKVPAPADLTLLSVAWSPTLGKYIAEAQQHSNAPLAFYVSDDLATQKWYPIGDTGSGYTSAAWYRWLVDPATSTTGAIVGKTLRSFCAFDCSNKKQGDWVDISITPSSAVAAPFDLSKTYGIRSASGSSLAADSSANTVTSTATSSTSTLQSWTFTATGDGSYTINNVGRNLALGVSTASTTNRAWGTKPNLSTLAASGPTTGQQWWIQRSVVSSSQTGASTPTASYRLINRYSGLVISLSGTAGREAETTPYRNWANATGSAVGGTRNSNDQAISIVAR